MSAARYPKAKTLTNTRLHSPWPYFLLTALLALVPVLNNKYPTLFFPVLSPFWVEVFSVFGGVFTATLAFIRGWARLQKRARAKILVREVGQNRKPTDSLSENDAAHSGRLISRLVRNADEDLLEIRPDFSTSSLSRLYRYLPALMDEIENEEDARIRLGVVGTYLGETACRLFHWQWFFKAVTTLLQFGYLASFVR